MGEFKKVLLILFLSFCTAQKGFCDDIWINDLRTLFQTNNAIIYAINIRTFNAKDLNKNGIIEEELGEERGSFINAIQGLNDLAASGVNTVQLLPVTPVGKIKASGTAGSLFAASRFDEINPQLKSSNPNTSVYDEMKTFVDECHKQKLRVIVDLPCCGAYDLYLKHPEYFKKDKNQNPIIPADWTDVRLLDAGTDDQINTDVYNLYKDFVELMLDMNVDGIRADEATLKPYTFWKRLIDETRKRNPQFLFLAENASDEPPTPNENIKLTPLNQLLLAGFDGYYGNYFELRNWKTANELYDSIKKDIAIAKKYNFNKSVLGNFATHDQISPILINGPAFSKMIIWLSSTLPMNSYYIDGFATGDTYIYNCANKKASTTYTDDDYYFVHRGQMDIFNFSRRPCGSQRDILEDFIMGNKLKSYMKIIITNGQFNPLKTNSPSIFAYEMSYEKQSLVVIGNLDFKKTQNAIVKVPKITKESNSIPIKITKLSPIIENGHVSTELPPGEVQVLYINNEIKKTEDKDKDKDKKLNLN